MNGGKNIPIKGLDDKRQITATFGCNAAGEFFPKQLIYTGQTERALPKIKFPDGFHVTQTANHWSNTEKSIEYFENVIFPRIKKIKEEDRFPEEQKSLIIMDNFKGQDNDPVTDLLTGNHCASRIVPHNLTDRFQHLDIQPAKAFISNKYNTWFSDIVSTQFLNGIGPAYIDVSTKISTLKPLHARWVCEL